MTRHNYMYHTRTLLHVYIQPEPYILNIRLYIQLNSVGYKHDTLQDRYTHQWLEAAVVRARDAPGARQHLAAIFAPCFKPVTSSVAWVIGARGGLQFYREMTKTAHEPKRPIVLVQNGPQLGQKRPAARSKTARS